MLWQDLTAKQFAEWVEKSEKVCLLPMGVLEKHGDHLPLGTDVMTASAISEKAAELSPAVVFPCLYFGQISEARHYKGTFAASHHLVLEVMLEVCDEIHRNGFTKILIVNSHGGNNYLVPFFMQEFPRHNRAYSVYSCTASAFSPEQLAQIRELTGVEEMGYHAGFKETALLLHLRPDTVHMDKVDVDQSIDQKRLNFLKDAGVYHSYQWYASFPYHFAGDPSQASAAYGEILFDMSVKNLVTAIDAIKSDTMSPALIHEFGLLGEKPQ